MQVAGFAQQAAQLAGSAFVGSLWQGTLLAVTVWLCLRLAPGATAALRFALWTAVLLLVVLLPIVEITSLRTAHNSILKVDLRWSFVLAALWVCVTLARAVSLARQTCRLRTLHRLATPVPPPEAIQPILTTSRRSVQLCTSNQIDRPGVIGFFAPRILIPAWLYPQLTAPELLQIVLHEIEHLRRRDDWLNLLQKFVLVLFPLNPVLIAVERMLCIERELACDDGVLCRTRAPRLYATCLAALAERSLDHRSLSLALSTLGGEKCRSKTNRSELGRRIQRIISSQTAASPLQTRMLTAVVALVLFASVAGLVRCPQLISFVPAAPSIAERNAVKPLQALHVDYADAQIATSKLVQASFALRQAHPHRRKPVAASRTLLRKENIVIAPEPTLLLTSLPEQNRPRFLTLKTDLPANGRFAVVRIDGTWIFVQL